MSEESKPIVRWFVAEVINTGHTDRAEEVVTADYVEHQLVPGAEGRQGIEVAEPSPTTSSTSRIWSPKRTRWWRASP
jgi:hypothetical protein